MKVKKPSPDLLFLYLAISKRGFVRIGSIQPEQ
jgi:hypothetical protein